MIKKSNLLIKLAVFLVAGLGSLFVFALLIKLAVTMLEQQEAVYALGNKVDGFSSVFTGARLAIVIGVLFYWKSLVRWYGKVRGLNLRQVYMLKAIYPYVAGFILITETLGLLF